MLVHHLYFAIPQPRNHLKMDTEGYQKLLDPFVALLLGQRPVELLDLNLLRLLSIFSSKHAHVFPSSG